MADWMKDALKQGAEQKASERAESDRVRAENDARMAAWLKEFDDAHGMYEKMFVGLADAIRDAHKIQAGTEVGGRPLEYMVVGWRGQGARPNQAFETEEYSFEIRRQQYRQAKVTGTVANKMVAAATREFNKAPSEADLKPLAVAWLQAVAKALS